MPYSLNDAIKRSAPTAFAATNECTSPSTCAGLRTFSGEQREQVLIRHAARE